MKDTLASPLLLSDLINRNSSRLTAADTRLLDVMIRDPIRAAMENGTDVSSRAGVHPASAVRLARRLGFKGYPEFRAFLQSSLRDGGNDFESSAARMAARLVRAEEGGLLASILDSEISALERLRASISDADIRAFAESLRDCRRRIYIIGRGHSSALSSLIALRLVRSGYDAVDIGSSMHQLPEVLHGLSKDDVLWILAFRNSPSIVREVRHVAAARGVRTLALTDSAARIEPPPDHQIVVSRGEPGESQSLVVPMTVANAVILDLAVIDDGRSLQSLACFRSFRAGLHD
ncbi:MurR/RpiR family transcriptional regulator [Rhizobium sp. Root1220]|uniref:MurR/RpiR family transcriptional regulator n=1 Tax=Rhizobium sp. Root1220 TaxID=1736432 RepID=UPI0007023942|nr:MurR/RpiR family transcriptional regulator [Rhizobium sp. Root1220]KQV84422.1 RpiR family transcriptional regulator [Rhizobium sp. Root1220]